MRKLKEYRLNRDDSPYSGKIHLYLTGFARQGIINIDEIVAAVDRLPDAHLQGLKELIFDPSRDSLEDVDYSQWSALVRSKGSFNLQHRYIYVYDFDSKEMFKQVLYHEIGHYVFYLVIGSVLKKQWVTQIYPNSQFISQYASRNASEDFAESYAAFVLRPKALMRIPKKYEFLRQRIFKGFTP